jgi:branched-chain amino acid transport system substrate-binding protein
VRERLVACTLLICPLLVVGAVSAAPETDGVTSKTVLLGGTVPLTHEAAAAGATAKGAEAYFKYVNSRGGVRGRKITYKYLDDEYDASKTVQRIRELVLQDKVFAVFNTLGTSNNIAVRPFLNQLKVPQLFVASGATTWGRDWRQFPWTLGLIPTYTGEGKIYARHLLKTRKNAKIAILYQDDDYGRDLVGAFEQGLGAKGRRQIVAKQSYDSSEADVRAEIARLKASGANTLMLFAFGKFAIQSFVFVKALGWKPQTYLNAVAAATSVMQIASGSGQTDGTITIGFFKDPADARWRRDSGYKLYAKIMRRYAGGADLRDGYYLAGMASAYAMTETLRKAGRNLTRAAVMRAALRLNLKNPFVLPGIRIRTSPTDHYPIERAQLQRWRKSGWRPVGKLVSAPR